MVTVQMGHRIGEGVGRGGDAIKRETRLVYYPSTHRGLSTYGPPVRDGLCLAQSMD